MTTPEELLTQEISRLFDETFEQVSGCYLDRGTSLFETLASILAEEASTPVAGSCANIAGFDGWMGNGHLINTLPAIVHTVYHPGEIRQALCTI